MAYDDFDFSQIDPTDLGSLFYDPGNETDTGLGAPSDIIPGDSGQTYYYTDPNTGQQGTTNDISTLFNTFGGDVSKLIGSLLTGYGQKNNWGNYGQAIRDIYGQLSGIISQAGTQEAGGFQDVAAQIDQMLNRSVGYVQPWMNAGQNALSQMMAGLQPGGQFNVPIQPFTIQDFLNNKDPVYNWMQSELANSSAAGAAAAGNPMSGNMFTGLQNRAANLANGEFSGAYGRWANTTAMQQNQLQTLFNQLAGVSTQGLNAGEQAGAWTMQGAGMEAGQEDQAIKALANGQTGAATAMATGQLAQAGAQFSGQSNWLNQLLGGVGQFSNILNNSQVMSNVLPSYGNPYAQQQQAQSSSGSNPMGSIIPMAAMALSML